MRRSTEGVYLSASNKYLADYASENVWREDTPRLSTDEKLRYLLRVAMRVGLSRWWRLERFRGGLARQAPRWHGGGRLQIF